MSKHPLDGGFDKAKLLAGDGKEWRRMGHENVRRDLTTVSLVAYLCSIFEESGHRGPTIEEWRAVRDGDGDWAHGVEQAGPFTPAAKEKKT